MLKHLHAGHHIEGGGALPRQVLNGDLLVGDVLGTRLHRMQFGHAQRFRRQVDTQHVRSLARHRIGQDAAAATDVQRRLALQAAEAVDPVQSQGIDLVKRLEFTFGIPPAVGQLAELLELFCIDIRHGAQW